MSVAIHFVIQCGKATWDSVAHTIFLDVCIEEVRANNRPMGCLNTIGYANLISKFNACTKRKYERKQFKNRWESLKKDYNYWKTLNRRASGLGRDPITKTIAASDDWWELEIQDAQIQPSLGMLLLRIGKNERGF